MARDLAEALDLAGRVRAHVEQTRERALDAGVPEAATLASDVYDLAAWVLQQEASTHEHPAVAALRRISGHLAPLVAEMSTALPLMSGAPGARRAARNGRPCACNPVGAGLSFACGGEGEYDTPCSCACHERAAAEPEVDLRQLAIPGCEPPTVQETPTPPEPQSVPARRRAEEQDQPIEAWEPEPMFLSSLQTALEDTDRVRERLVEFRREKAGQKAKRWPSVFRSWLAKQRGQPSGDRPLQEMP